MNDLKALSIKFETINGITFEFKDGDNVIIYNKSNFIGMGIVTFNGEEVSKSRSLSFTSRHIFNHNGHEYEVNAVSTKLLKGGVEVSILKDRYLIARDVFYFLSMKNWKVLLIIFSTAFIAGFITATLKFNFY